jgi:hypothetical protein
MIRESCSDKSFIHEKSGLGSYATPYLTLRDFPLT